MDDLHTTPPDDILRDWLMGQDSAATQAVEAWAGSDTARHDWLAQLRTVYGSRENVLRQFDKDAAWARMRSQMSGTKFRRVVGKAGDRPATRRRLRMQTLLHRVIAYGLTTTGAVLLGAFGMIVWEKTGGRQSARRPEHRYATLAGQQAMVTLADGSRAVLGPATTFSVMPSSSVSFDVRVEGQVLFTVVGQRGRAFRVHTQNAVTQVLGTTFLVRRYGTDSMTRVVVTDGRVSLSGTRGKTVTGIGHVLGANALGIVTDSGQVRVTPHITTDEYLGWTTGKLVFRDTPARDAVLELGRAYGVDIRIADSTLAARPLSWSVVITQRSLVDVLEPLSAVLGAHPVRIGRVILLMPGRSTSQKTEVPSSLSSSESRYGR